MNKKENIRSGKDIKKELELDFDKAELVGDLWALYNIARVEGYVKTAAEILKKIDKRKKEIEGE